MKKVELDNTTKNALIFALCPEGKQTAYQQTVLQVINLAVMGSEDSEELLKKLMEASDAFADAVEVVLHELKLSPKGNISLDKRRAS